jgi:hypothetical protein
MGSDPVASGLPDGCCQSRLTIELPFVILLPDGAYSGRSGPSRYTVGLELIASLTGDSDKDNGVVIAPYTGQVVDVGVGVEVPGAGIRHTRAYVEFAMALNGLELAAAEKRSKLLSAKLLNCFLDSFRVLFNEPRVYALSPSEMFSARYGYAPRWWFDVGRHIQRGVTFGDYPLHVTAVGAQRPEQVDLFRKQLAMGPPPLVDSLLMDSSTYLMRGDNRLSVVTTGCAIDICVEDAALSLLARAGKLDRRSRDQLESISPTAIMRDYIAPLCGDSIPSNPCWLTYTQQIRPLRNKCVHDAYEPSTEEAESSLCVARSLASLLFSLSGDFAAAPSF